MAERRVSVLLVEDDGVVAPKLRAALESLGYDAYAIATTSDDAIARATERAPDVVLMDIHLDGPRDGIDTAEILRCRFGAPIVYLTGHADDATLARAKLTQPYGYLVKPVTPREMHSAIEIALHRHALETQHRERERWFSTTLRSIGDAVIAVDLAGAVRFMNPAAEQLTGLAEADAIGRAASAIVDGSIDQPWAQAIASGKTISRAEVVIEAASGQRVVTDTVAPVIDDGNTLGAVMVIRDITDEKVTRRYAELAERLAALDKLGSRLAHQVNNPLAVIAMQGGLIRDQLVTRRDQLATTHPEAIGRLNQAISAQDEVDKAVGEIVKIMTDVRAFLQPTPSAGKADVRRAIEWAVKASAHEFRDRARVVTTIEVTRPVELDETRLGQILVNVLVNAAHSIAPGNAGRNSVTLTARSDGDRVVIETRDSGRGLAPELVARVFEPSFTTTHGAVGVGVGLSMSRRIAREVGGDVELESTAGHGTLVRVVLPHAGRAAIVATDRDQRGRVLIIDDDDSYLRGIRRALRGHEVTCCTTVTEALAELARDSFDVVLAEMRMPDMSGIELYERVVRDHPVIAARIVFVAAPTTNDRFGEFLATVPNHRIEKPMAPAALRALVRELIANPPTP